MCKVIYKVSFVEDCAIVKSSDEFTLIIESGNLQCVNVSCLKTTVII